MSTSLVFASMLSYLLKPISSCICYFALLFPHLLLVCYKYILYSYLLHVAKHSFIPIVSLFCLWLPLSSIVSVLPSFTFIIEFCFLKQMQQQQQQQVLRFIFGGDLWDFGLLYFMFCDYFAENSSIVSRTWSWQTKANKRCSQYSCRNEFLVFRVFVSIW